MRLAHISSILLCIIFSCQLENTTTSNLDTLKKIEPGNYKGFSSEQARYYHRIIRDSSLIWLNGNGDLARYAFLHLSEFQKHSILHKKGSSNQLKRIFRTDVDNFSTHSRFGPMPLNEYIKRDEVDGIIILHHGKIVFEEYPRMFPYDLHIWFSVSKVVVSTAIGILEDRKMLDVDLPIDHYFNELKGSGWEGVPVVDILSMSSGIDCPEIFTAPESACFLSTREMYGWPDSERVLTDPIHAFSRLKRKRPSGQVFEYTSVNTMLLTLLIERITGDTYKNFIEKEIWDKIGVETDGLLLIGAYGRYGSWLGINSTLRDLARFGLLFTPVGRKVDQPVVSDQLLTNIQVNWNQDLSTKSWFSDELKHNGYQWDEIYDDGDFYKHGHCAQGLYISPSKDLVIAFFGTKSEDFTENQLPLVARQLATSGLFKD